MWSKTVTGLAAAVWLATTAAQAVELEKLERKIAKQPVYNAEEPLYGLVVIGPRAKSRVWMVLDKENPETAAYDVLYADLNGNGDLTEPAERFTADDRFNLPDFTDPETGDTHTEFNLRASQRRTSTHMISLLWRGEEKIGGGYPEDPETGYMRFAASAEKAPVLWINGDGPFRFQRWYSDKFKIGGADDLKVFLGNEGVGPNSFCAFQRHVLPEGEAVGYTLLYTDTDGNAQEVSGQLPLRC